VLTDVILHSWKIYYMNSLFSVDVFSAHIFGVNCMFEHVIMVTYLHNVTLHSGWS